MDQFSHLELRSLIEQPKGQSVSIYLPTHRVKEEAPQDPIRLKNLLRQVERKLAEEGRDPAAIKETVEPALSLLEDRDFWQQQTDGLALSGKAPRLFRGSRFRFEEVGMRNAPTGLADVTPYVERQKSLQVYNSGGAHCCIPAPSYADSDC